MRQRVHPGGVRGELMPPPDKSISHRALLFSGFAHGISRLSNLLLADDVLSTWHCLESLGVRLERQGGEVLVHGSSGLLRQPQRPLNVGNSGTTLRLLTGLLAAQPFVTTLVGDSSLNRRPLRRVLQPLQQMGAKAYATPTGTAPVVLLGQQLHGLSYRLPVASAQLKSALLLAAVQAHGGTEIADPVPSRDHSERMLRAMGVDLVRRGDCLQLVGPQRLLAHDWRVPGDISSASPLIAAAVLGDGSQLQVQRVGINPTRIGFLNVLRRMGADLQIYADADDAEEPVGSVSVRGDAGLHAVEVCAEEIPLLIDEVPLLIVVACFARGQTAIHGISELRVKESDRVESMLQPLRQLGAKVDVVGDSLRVEGEARPFTGGQVVSSAGDHRIAMALAVAATKATKPLDIDGAEWVSISYPEFFPELRRLQGGRTCDF